MQRGWKRRCRRARDSAGYDHLGNVDVTRLYKPPQETKRRTSCIGTSPPDTH